MKSLSFTLLIIATLVATCNKSNDDDNPGGGGGGGGNLSISSTSPEYVFWGQELTINGVGFSTNANENIVYIKGNKSCDPDTTWQKATVVGNTLNIKDSVFTGATCSGFRFVLDAQTYSELNNCVQPAGHGGGAARKFTFSYYTPGRKSCSHGSRHLHSAQPDDGQQNVHCSRHY